jgi:hypothetical protein
VRNQGAEVEVLARGYLEGSTISELAVRFRIHRNTIMELLEKSGVDRRGKRPSHEEVGMAVVYEHGHSTSNIGSMIGFSGETIRQSLLTNGARIRGPHEWLRSSNH